MNSAKITCPACGTSNPYLVKKCQGCGESLAAARGPAVSAPVPPSQGVSARPRPAAPVPSAHRPATGVRVPSGTRIRMDGNPAEVLKALCSPFDAVETRCPECRERASIQAPFNLDIFACTRCGAEMYPYVWIEDCLVDLNGMREVLAAIHYEPRVARAALSSLRADSGRGAPLEPLLHSPTVAAHAIVSCTVAAGSQFTPWTLLGVLHPGLFAAIGPIQLAREKFGAKGVAERLLASSLSRQSFDPRSFPDFQPNSNTIRVLERLNLRGSWPGTLYGGAESYGALGARESSSWSLVFDRREQLDGRATVDVHSADIVADIVSTVVNSDPDKDVVRSERQLVLARINDLPVDSSTRQRLLSDGTPDQGSPRARRVCTPSRVLETVNLSTGDVDWSCLRAQDQGPMIGVRWATFHRSAWARGVSLRDKFIDPAQTIAAEAERKAILDAEGGILEQWSDAIPAWIKRAFLFVTMSMVAWLALSVPLGIASFALDSAPQYAVRVAFAGLLGTMWWARHKAIRNPFPQVFWDPKQLSRQEAKARRIEDIRTRIAKLWRNFDYSAPRPISTDLGAVRVADRLDRESAAFAVHCQDRLIQDAMVEVAERHGIDMSKFKENMQQINNYGVIATHIDGPVATGDGATAQQTKSIPEKLGAATRSILKSQKTNKTPQAGAA